MTPLVLVHGGAGARLDDQDGCVAAAHAGIAALRADGDALSAAIAAVEILEDDPRFNAGSGSSLRLDGHTIEMDAAIMDSRGSLGAVACVQRVRNPVQLAAAVTETPHWLLCGSGAQQYARQIGLPDYDPTTPNAQQRHQQILDKLRDGQQLVHGYPNSALTGHWNFPRPCDLPAGAACDTVGAVAREAGGHFAVAVSTGGAAPALLGRVGDSPIIGAGFYAGKDGAVAVTGIGEQIVRHLLAYRVYEWLAGGMAVKLALERALALFDPAIDMGLIAVTASDSGSISNRQMPTAAATLPGG